MINQHVDITFSIGDFVKNFPHVWLCDERLHTLKIAETLRNEYEAYHQKNCGNIPTIDQLARYSDAVREQQYRELMENVEITDTTGYRFTDGKLYRLKTDSNGDVHEKMIFAAPLRIMGIVQMDDAYSVEFKWLEKDITKPIDEFLTFINSRMKLSGTAKQNTAEFVYGLIKKAKDSGLITPNQSPVYIDDDRIRVRYDVSGIDIQRNLRLIREFHDKSTNPHAYRAALAMATIAPLSYYVKKYARSGFIFPITVFSGDSKTGKTSILGLFIVAGFDQDPKDADLPAGAVATAFTLGDALSNGVLPVIFNDLNQGWFTRNSESLKNLTEHTLALVRGRPDLTVTTWDARRLPFLTTNGLIQPGDDSALNRRYVLEVFTSEHRKRRNESIFTEIWDKLQHGFLFAVVKELYEGINIHELASELGRAVDSSQFVQSILNHVNKLCEKLMIPMFPPYVATEQSLMFADDDFINVIEFAISEFKKLQTTDYYGGRKASDLTLDDIDVDFMPDSTIVWLTATGYKKMWKKLGLRHTRITELISDYVDNSTYGITANGKFHRFNQSPGRGYALWIKHRGV